MPAPGPGTASDEASWSSRVLRRYWYARCSGKDSSYETFFCLTKASSSVKTEKVLIFFTKGSSFALKKKPERVVQLSPERGWLSVRICHPVMKVEQGDNSMWLSISCISSRQ